MIDEDGRLGHSGVELICDFANQLANPISRKQAGLVHASTSFRSLQIVDSGINKPRSRNCAGAVVSASSCLAGRNGTDHGSDNDGRLRVQRGLAMPASSAIFSAIAARIVSISAQLDCGGSGKIACAVMIGWRITWSTNPLNRVQSGCRVSVASSIQASLRSARRGWTRFAVEVMSELPRTAKSFSSVDQRGCSCPFSIREIVG